MADLLGGTTIGGYTALHSGLREAYLGGNLTINGSTLMSGDLTINGKTQMGIGSTLGILGRNAKQILVDHNNGNVTLSATDGQLYLGYQTTSGVRISSNLYASNGTTIIADTGGKIYHSGQDADARYVRMASDPYVATDLSGTTAYPRLVTKNSGATTSPNWIRVSSDTEGLLPYSNGNSYLGTSSWKFKEVHGVTLYENGTALSSKYAAAGHNHDGTYVNVGNDAAYNLNVYSNTNSSAYTAAGLEIRELNQAGAQTGALSEAPSIALHWSGRVASQISLNTDGTVMIRNNPGTSYEKLAALDITANGTVYGTAGVRAGSSGRVYVDSADNLDTKIAWWGPTNSYGMGMSSAFTFGYLNDYATFFNMNNDTDRGWIFRADGMAKSDGAMSLTTDGRMYLKNIANVEGLIIRSYDFSLGSGYTGRGDTGTSRAMVKDSGGVLTINYNGDFYGGVKINSNLVVTGDISNSSGYNVSWHYSTDYVDISSAGWYRLASNAGSRAFGKFTVLEVAGGKHHVVQFTAGIAYNNISGASINQLANAKYGGSAEIIGGLRFLTAGTYDTQYLDVYLAAGARVKFVMEENYWSSGWTPGDLAGPQGIPTGYTQTKMEMQEGYLNRPQNVYSGTSSPPSQGAWPGDVYIQY